MRKYRAMLILLLAVSAGFVKGADAMKAIDLQTYFTTLGPGQKMDWNKTIDIFTFGDPQTEIKGVAVAWKPTFAALKEAAARGANVFISHESIAMNAKNYSMKQDIEFMRDSEKEMFDWLTENNMVVYRCHDLLDRVEPFGVRRAWHEGLELGGEVVYDKYPHLITKISPCSLRNLAKHIAAQTAPLRQDGVLVVGDLDKEVSRVGTGTGMSYKLDSFYKAGADVVVCTDDAHNQVRQGSHYEETGMSMIIVNHGVSEEWALRNLAQHLQEQFPDISVFHIPQFSPFTHISAN